MMKYVLLLLIATSAFATTVELNQKRINLGNLGAGDVIYQNGYFNLERTSATPKIVKVDYQIKVTEMQCVRYERRAYPCGGYYGGGYRRRRGGRVGYPAPYPGRPYPGPGYRYPAPGYGYPGACFDTVCVERAPVQVNKNMTLKLNFRKAQKLMSGEVENFEVQFSANGNRAAVSATAPAGYTVKNRRNKTLKFKKSIK
jgi:hypothetical protein